MHFSVGLTDMLPKENRNNVLRYDKDSDDEENTAAVTGDNLNTWACHDFIKPLWAVMELCINKF